MAVYLVVASLIFWVGYLRKDKKAYLFSLVLLCIITAIRDWHLGGTDAIIYHRYFLNAVDWNSLINGDYGIGYVLLNYIIRSVTDNYLIYQIIYAILSTVLLHFVFTKIDITWEEKCIAIFGYFCLRFIYNDWIALRQNFANLIFWFFLISAYQCDKKKKIKKLIYIVAALFLPQLFHSSAAINYVLILGVWGLSKVGVRKKAIIIPVAALAINAAGSRLLGPAVDFMTTYISDSYEAYINSEEFGSNAIYFVLRIMFFWFFCYRYNNDKTKTRDAIMNIFSLMILVASVDLQIMSRAFEYYAIGLYAAIGTFFRSFEGKSKDIAAIVFYLCMMIILARFLLTFNSPPFTPYRLWRG